jgi:hypothetical protein
MKMAAERPAGVGTPSSEGFMGHLSDSAEQGDRRLSLCFPPFIAPVSSAVVLRETHERAKQLLKASAAQGHSGAASALACMKACASCSAPRPRFMCQRCHDAKYCDQEC